MLIKNYSLQAMQSLMSYFGNPMDKLRCIHVAGTNGKGSTVAFLGAILRAAGKNVGSYTSPSLTTYHENIRLNGEAISNGDAERLMQKVEAAQKALGLDLSSFEKETAIAFLWFSECGVDYAVVECGLGGRFDATNVIAKPVLAVITSISLEHTDMLGGTLEEIRWHKEGIIKGDCPVVRAENLGKICVTEGDAFSQRFNYTALGGQAFNDLAVNFGAEYEVQNAALAIEAALCLGVEKEHIFGIKDAKCFGRFSVLQKDPLFIVDGAHNPSGVAALLQSVKKLDKPVVFVVGFCRDKAVGDMIAAAAQVSKRFYLIGLSENKRILTPPQLAEIVVKYSCEAFVTDSIKAAVSGAIEDARMCGGMVVAFGSLYTINAVQNSVQEVTEQCDN